MTFFIPFNETFIMFVDNVSANAKPTPPAWVWFDNNTLPAHSLDEAQEKTQVRFAFWIMAVINVSDIVII